MSQMVVPLSFDRWRLDLCMHEEHSLGLQRNQRLLCPGCCVAEPMLVEQDNESNPELHSIP